MKSNLVGLLIWVSAGMGVIGCTLDEIADLGFSCSDVEGIKLASGTCRNADDEAKQCEGCDEEDISKCKGYISKGVFKLERCPKEYVCSTVKESESYDVDANVCLLGRSSTMNCSVDQVYVCDRGDTATCETSCQFCDTKKYSCFLLVGTEEGGRECTSGSRECRESDSYLCVNGVWTLDTACPEACDGKTGRCKVVQEPVGEKECVGSAKKCEGDSIFLCDNGKWKFEKKCSQACVDGACSNGVEPPPEVEECKEGAVDCRENIPRRCLYGNWAEKSACEYGCDQGVCKDPSGGVVDPPVAECSGDEKKCSDGNLKICSQGEWFTQICSYGCVDNQCIEIGAQCTSVAFQQMCINENANALICHSGVITKIRCAENNCTQNPNDPMIVSCTDNCSADSTRRCAPACGSDDRTGYFWNNSGKVQTVTCANSHCEVTDGYVNCGGKKCTKESKERCVPACSEDGKTGYWMSNSNIVHTINCPKGDCFYYKGTLTCGEPEYCKVDDYTPTCSDSQTSQGQYCSSDGVVKTYTCRNSFCKIRRDGICEGAASCEGGRYSNYDYPNGFLDCVEDPNAVPDLPEKCQVGTSSALCIGQELYICGNDNKYYRSNICSSDAPCTVKNGYGQCGDFETCTYQKDPAKCKGQDLYICSSNNIYVKKETCAENKKCTVNNEGYGQCGAFEACTYKTSPAKCDGMDLYVCGSNNKYYKAETCTEHAPCTVKNGYGQCGKIETCTSDSPAQCKDNDLYICKNGQYQKTQHCTEDKPCQVDQASGFGYCGSVETCKHKVTPASCKGQDLFVCNKYGYMTKSMTCAPGTSCKVTAGGFGLCLEDESPGLCTRKQDPAVCKGQDLYLCDSYGYYFKYQTCNASERCNVSQAGYGECLPQTLPTKCTKGAKAYCIDNKLYTCNSSSGVYYMKNDCGKLKCQVNDSGYGQCVINETCTANTCLGSTKYICKDGHYYTVDCEAGKECKNNAGYVMCLPNKVPVSCTDKSPAICDGKELYVCNKKYHHYSYNKTCGSNETCTVSSSGYGACQVLPPDITGLCTGAKCSAYDGYAYYCNSDTHTYYLQDSGKCTAGQKCVACSNGYGGCGITCH